MGLTAEPFITALQSPARLCLPQLVQALHRHQVAVTRVGTCYILDLYVQLCSTCAAHHLPL